VATPDYTVTPQGASYGDPAIQSAGIRRNNAILERLAAERGIAYVDTHDLSLLAATDHGLVADDGLHPSGAQYTLWVDRIAPVVEDLLRA
jgi:lysophospholipase L1-like esterase